MLHLTEPERTTQEFLKLGDEPWYNTIKEKTNLFGILPVFPLMSFSIWSRIQSRILLSLQSLLVHHDRDTFEEGLPLTLKNTSQTRTVWHLPWCKPGCASLGRIPQCYPLLRALHWGCEAVCLITRTVSLDHSAEMRSAGFSWLLLLPTS